MHGSETSTQNSAPLFFIPSIELDFETASFPLMSLSNCH